MFGMGGSEIIVILIVALLFLGPDKLPQAAKSLSKGIRDIKKQSRSLQQQIESDEQIGGAIRDLKSALRGEEAPAKPKPIKRVKKELPEPASDSPNETTESSPEGPAVADHVNGAEPTATPLTLPTTVGEPGVVDPEAASGPDDDLAAMVKPASGSVAKGT